MAYLGDLTSNIRNCKYYNIDCKIFKTKTVNALMLLYVNVRFLHKNYELLYEIIEALQILPPVICITETCIKNQPLSNLDLPNYSFVHVKTTTNAGEVAMYCIYLIILNIRYLKINTNYATQKPCLLILSIRLIHLMLSE